MRVRKEKNTRLARRIVSERAWRALCAIRKLDSVRIKLKVVPTVTQNSRDV